MAVANYSTYEEAANKIKDCLLKEIKVIESLVTKLNEVSSNPLCEMDTEMIKELVGTVYSEAQQAYNVASGYAQKIQSNCEKLTEEKGGLQKEMKDQKIELASLQSKLNTIKTEKKMHEKRLQEAESSLRLAEAALQKLKDHEKTMEIVRNVGLLTSFIPIVGVAGTLTALGCEISRRNALEDQQKARNHVCSMETHVSRCSSDLRDCNSSIEKKRDEIIQIEKKIQAVDNELKSQQELLEKLFETDTKLKCVTTVLNELAGKVEVLKFRSEKFLHLEALLTVVDDLVLHISHLPSRQGGEALCLETNAVEMLKSLRSNMKAIGCSDAGLSEWY